MPPSVRSAAAEAAAAHPPPVAPAAPPQNSLLGLPEELLHLVADALLHKHLPSALRLSQACTALRGRLAAVRAAAEARRLRWVAEVTDTNVLATSDEGRALTRVGYGQGGIWGHEGDAWAAGSLLPTVGRVSFSVRIERSRSHRGVMHIGVCTAANTDGWGLHPFYGKLWRYHRDADGSVRFADERAPPANYPNGDNTQVMFNAAGRPANLQGRANGTVIEVIVDHNEGSLAFRVDGKLTPALRGFPKGAPLRTWASFNREADRILFKRGYHREVV